MNSNDKTTNCDPIRASYTIIVPDGEKCLRVGQTYELPINGENSRTCTMIVTNIDPDKKTITLSSKL